LNKKYIYTLDGQEAGEGVTPDPFGIKILRITRSALGGQSPGGRAMACGMMIIS
jgi:hypothetical protein